MHRSIAWTLIAWTLAGAMARAEAPVDPASRAWEIAEVILARHVDPPTRQQMILAGFKAVATERDESLPANLARRVSDLTAPDQLASLLAETWAGPKATDRAGRERGFFKGMLSAVAGKPELLSAKERKVADQIEGNVYVGIQVALGMDETAHRPILHTVLEGGPAQQAGARDGDTIEAIDGVSTEGMPLLDVIDRLRGDAGTVVEVAFRRPKNGEVFTKPMTRGRLPRTTVEGFTPLPGKRWRVRLEGNPPIGYLKIKEISGSTVQEIRTLAEQFEDEGLKGLILDFRHVEQVGFHPTILLADALLDGGTIGVVKSVDADRTYRAEPDGLFRGIPIVAVVTGPIAPEMAWLLDALIDNHRATLVGKPVISEDPDVEEKVELAGGDWSIRMTTCRLLRGDGSRLSTPIAKRSKEFGELLKMPNEEPSVFLAPYAGGPNSPPRPTIPVPATLPARSNEVDINSLARARESLEKTLGWPGK